MTGAGIKSAQEMWDSHLESFHGFVSWKSIQEARRRVVNLATPSGIPTANMSVDEVLHAIEHSEHHTYADYDNAESERIFEAWVAAGRPDTDDEDTDYHYYLPHHHDGDIVTVDVELDLDDEMIDNQP